MNRRAFLAAAATGGVLGSAGCLGMGGEVVTSIQRTVSVDPGSGWIEEVPDVSEYGGTISYITRARRPYDVYFFTSAEAMQQYRAYLKGEEPAETPQGDRDIGRTATAADDEYMATSTDGGGRQSIEATGPYYFVLDNSGYPAGGAFPDEDDPQPRSVFLDLSVTARRYPLPF